MPLTTTYWLEHAWIDPAVEPGVALEVADGRITSVRTGWRPRPGRRGPAGPDGPGPGQRPLARLPPRPARHRPGRLRHLLDLARHHVQDRPAPHPRQLLRPGPRGVRGDGARRHHLRRRVPLPPPRPRRHPLHRPQRHGRGPDRGRHRGRHPHHPPRHRLPLLRLRRRARAPPAPLHRRHGGRLGRAGLGPQGAGRRTRRGGDPLRTAVPADQLATVADWARRREAPPRPPLGADGRERRLPGGPRPHPHTTPLRTRRARAPDHRGPQHHLTPGDIALIGSSSTGTCMCPTTERDLADGIGPAVDLQRAGSPSPWAATATRSSTSSKRRGRWS